MGWGNGTPIADLKRALARARRESADGAWYERARRERAIRLDLEERLEDARAEVHRLDAEVQRFRALEAAQERGIELDRARDLLYEAWAVIANSGVFGGDPSDGALEAAIRWRDAWHETLNLEGARCAPCASPYAECPIHRETPARPEPDYATGAKVRFGFSDADPVAYCLECPGWRAVGGSAVDAFSAWWAHVRRHHPNLMD